MMLEIFYRLNFIGHRLLIFSRCNARDYRIVADLHWLNNTPINQLIKTFTAFIGN
jgi:hypothetical protein